MTSFIIPIFNTEKYLPKCLDSLLNQSDSAWEAILVDDASTDSSLCIAEQYAAQDKRFKIVKHEHNRGQSAARNTGMQMANGEFLAFLDSDDTLEKNWLKTMTLNIGPFDVLQTGYKRVTTTGETLMEDCPSQKRRFTFTSPCMRLYRRAFLEEHHLRFREGIIYEDVLFSAQLWKANPTIKVMRYTGYRYLLNDASTTARPHNTGIIRKALRDERIGLFQYNALRLRLIAHFGKERLAHLLSHNL